MSKIITKEQFEQMDNIRKNYPRTLEWINGKSQWERMIPIAVMRDYKIEVRKLMDEEDETELNFLKRLKKVLSHNEIGSTLLETRINKLKDTQEIK